MAKRIVLKIDELIEQSGLGKVKFAEKVGIRAGTICDYAKTDNNSVDKVSLKNLAKIAEVLELTDISQLIKLEDIED